MVKTKGARPSPKKPDAVRRRAPPTLTLVPSQDISPVPALPRSYAASVRKAWRDYWRSPISKVVKVGGGEAALVHWAWCMNELAKVLPVLSAAPVIDGPGRSVVLNPLAQYAQHLRTAIARVEIEFGMTPLARERLGLAIGEARLTAQELNRRLTQSQPPAGDEPQRDDDSWEEVES